MNRWDKKAKNYSRYSEDKDRFENRIFEALKSLHVDIQNKTLLDIGCGTGVYTLHMAKKALHVDGIDFSKEMLELLNEDAKTLGLTNIKTEVATWKDFQPKIKYDFALCTMSPALGSSDDFEKMDSCAIRKIYLGWAGKRDSNILDKMFEVHGSKYIPSNGAKKLQEWLNAEKKFYHIVPFEEKKVSTREFNESVENFEWHLDIRGLNPDREKIVKVLKEFRDKDNFVTEVTINHFNLIVW